MHTSGRSFDRRLTAAGPKLGELGQLLLNLVNVVPAGLVVFFSSYSILNTVRRLWITDKTLDRIGLRKKVSTVGTTDELCRS